MMVGMEEEDATMAAASSECSSGCQSGWTTYLDDSSGYSYSCGAARALCGKVRQPCSYGCDGSEEAGEDDLSMVSDASSGPRQQYSAGSDEGAAAQADRRLRRMESPAARRQGKTAAVVSLLEDTASSPAFFKCSKAMSSADANGSGNAADFSCAFSATTNLESGSSLGRYLQVQYSSAPPVKAMPTRQVRRDGASKVKRW